jgi:hypothetical protein
MEARAHKGCRATDEDDDDDYDIDIRCFKPSAKVTNAKKKA